MKLFSTMPRIAKGQLRCHDCREVVLMKEGDWHDRGDRQVFLCKACHKIQHELQSKPPSSR